MPKDFRVNINQSISLSLKNNSVFSAGILYHRESQRFYVYKYKADVYF